MTSVRSLSALTVVVGLSAGCSDLRNTTTIEEALSEAIGELAPAHIFDPPEAIDYPDPMAVPLDYEALSLNLGLPLERIAVVRERGRGCVVSPPVGAFLTIDTAKRDRDGALRVTVTYHSTGPPCGQNVYGVTHEIVLQEDVSRGWGYVDAQQVAEH